MNNYEKLIAALTAPAADFELVCQQLLTLRSIYVAIGVQLDEIGDIVGQDRNGLDDDDYRRYLFARIATNRSAGKRSDLITISKLILNDPSATVYVDNQGTAAVVVRILEMVLGDALAEILLSFLQLAPAAGVRIILETATADDAHSFTTGVTAFATGTPTAGDTTIAVGSTAGFPASGSLVLDAGLAVQETVTYTGVGPTTFLGVSALAHNHVTKSAVQWADSPGLGFALSTFPAGALSIGDTTITASTTGFPSSGSLEIDHGLAVAETVTYAGITGTAFTGVSALTQNHAATSPVQSTAVGGMMADARS